MSEPKENKYPEYKCPCCGGPIRAPGPAYEDYKCGTMVFGITQHCKKSTIYQDVRCRVLQLEKHLYLARNLLQHIMTNTQKIDENAEPALMQYWEDAIMLNQLLSPPKRLTGDQNEV